MLVPEAVVIEPFKVSDPVDEITKLPDDEIVTELLNVNALFKVDWAYWIKTVAELIIPVPSIIVPLANQSWPLLFTVPSNVEVVPKL